MTITRQRHLVGPGANKGPLSTQPGLPEVETSNLNHPTFAEATHSCDPRSPHDLRPQPWRDWWPPRSRPLESNPRASQSPLLGTLARDQPWTQWVFNNESPWDKPWVHWPLSWSPKYYGQTEFAPEVVHDKAFISETLQTQPETRVSKFSPPRTTSLVQFFKTKPGHGGEKPYACRVPVTAESQMQSNFEGDWRQIMVTDVTGLEDMFSLDNDGFEWLSHTSKHVNLDDMPSFDVHAYMQDMSTYLREHYQCNEVFIYDYVRRSPAKGDRDSGFSDITRRIHCDQTPRSAIGRIKLHLGDRAEHLLRGRCRILSVWRPLLPVIEAHPLTACSFRSTTESDLIPIDVVYPHYAEESFEINFNSLHRWYFKSAMTPDDLMVIKLFDNKLDGNTAFCAPHGSFRDPRSRKDAPARRSIELRCILFG